MTFYWGKSSRERLNTCCPEIQTLANELLARLPFDISITCGYRDKPAQETAYNNGTSRARFGESAHNCFPSKAIDIVPVNPDWDNANDWRWWCLVATAQQIAKEKGFDITCGAFFKKLKDMPHFELTNWKALTIR